MKFFLLFLFWTFVGSSYAAVAAIWRAIACYKSRLCFVPSTPILAMGIFSTVMAIFFAIFVVAMAWDQYTGLTTDTTAIEAMKAWDETARSVGEGLVDACGEKMGWRWFLPIAMPATSPSFYKWSKNDDPDAFDRRDPVVQRHMARVRQLAAQLDAAHARIAAGQSAGGGFDDDDESDSREMDDEDEDDDEDGDYDDDEDDGEEGDGYAGGGGGGGAARGAPTSATSKAPLSMKSDSSARSGGVAAGADGLRQRATAGGGGGGGGGASAAGASPSSRR